MSRARKSLKFLCCVLLLALVSWSVVVAAQKTLVWGEDRDMKTLDPRITQSRHELQVIRQIFDNLVTIDDSGKVLPWLAESWEINQDYSAITLHLRKGVSFHDGTPFNAEAVKVTFDTIANPKLGSQAAIDYLGPYDGTTVVDEFTAIVRFKRPYSAVLVAFASSYLGIVSPTALAALGDAGFAQAPVGTGPFKFVEWVRGSHIKLARFDAYNWAPPNALHQGPAKIDEVLIRMILDGSTRVGALETGEIDVSDMVPPLDTLSFRDDPNYKVLLGRVAGIPLTMFLNTSHAPLDDINVRRAVYYALDRAKLADSVYFGLTQPAYSIITPSTPCYWSGAESMYPYDPDKARRLLEEAGWVDANGDGIREKNGVPLKLFTAISLHPEFMPAVQGELKKVGIDMQIENVTGSREVDLAMNNQYEVMLVRWVAIDPSVLEVLLYSGNIPAPGYFKFNQQRYADPYIDQLLADAEAAATPEMRCSVYEELQQIALNAALLVPLFETTQTVVHKAAITGLRYDIGNYQVIFYDADWGN